MNCEINALKFSTCGRFICEAPAAWELGSNGTLHTRWRMHNHQLVANKTMHLAAGGGAPRLEQLLEAPVGEAQREPRLPGWSVLQKELHVWLPVRELGTRCVIVVGNRRRLQQLLPCSVRLRPPG